MLKSILSQGKLHYLQYCWIKRKTKRFLIFFSGNFGYKVGPLAQNALTKLSAPLVVDAKRTASDAKGMHFSENERRHISVIDFRNFARICCENF